MSQLADEPAKPAQFAARTFTVIRVHVLAEKRDLAHPRRRQMTRFRQDLNQWTRILRAARIGDDTEAAELIASLLDCEKSRHRLARRRLWQVVKFRLGGKIGGNDAAIRSAQGARD